MNITYIIGNGFDIQCGLDSRYSDFLKEYTVIHLDDSDNIKKFKQYLLNSKNQALWSNAEKAMGEHLQYFSADNIDQYLERIVDFESKMADYLEAQQSRCHWESPFVLADIFQDFLSRSFEDIMSNEIHEFANSFIWNRLNFITFNYTNILDRLLEFYPKEYNIYHVHGSLKSSIIMGVNDSGQVQLGDRIKLTDRLKRQIIKPVMCRELGYNWENSAMRAIENSEIIAIFGVSFGETDNIWWKAIREWLIASKHHKVVAFVKTAKKYIDRRIAWQVLDYEEEESPKILEKLGFERDHPQYKQLLKQIYTIPNTRRLNIKPVLLGEVSKEKTAEQAAMKKSDSGTVIV